MAIRNEGGVLVSNPNSRLNDSLSALAAVLGEGIGRYNQPKVDPMVEWMNANINNSNQQQPEMQQQQMPETGFNTLSSVINPDQQQMQQQQMQENGINTLSNVLNPGQQQQMPQKRQFSDEDLVKMTAAPYRSISEYAKNELKRRETNQTFNLKQTANDFKQNSEYLKEIAKKRSSRSDSTIIRIEDALKSNDLKSLRNYLADTYQIDALRTSSGAALQSAVKELLLTDISRITGRPNLFLEKQLSDSYPKAGNNEEANRKIIEAIKLGSSLKNKEIEIFDKYDDLYEKAGKSLPGNIQKIVDKELKTYVEKEQRKLERIYKDINSGEYKEFVGKTPSNSLPMVDTEGNKVYIEKSQLQTALRKGYAKYNF